VKDGEEVRPYGVKVIARLELLAGMALIGFGAGIIALSDIIPLGDLGISALGKGGLIIYGGAAIVLGILSLLLATGVWSMTSVGRKLALVSCMVGIFVAISVAGILGQVTFVFDLVVYPMIIYYLSVKNVRDRYI
jgi:hypothetical protein